MSWFNTVLLVLAAVRIPVTYAAPRPQEPTSTSLQSAVGTVTSATSSSASEDAGGVGGTNEATGGEFAPYALSTGGETTTFVWEATFTTVDDAGQPATPTDTIVFIAGPSGSPLARVDHLYNYTFYINCTSVEGNDTLALCDETLYNGTSFLYHLQATETGYYGQVTAQTATPTASGLVNATSVLSFLTAGLPLPTDTGVTDVDTVSETDLVSSAVATASAT